LPVRAQRDRWDHKDHLVSRERRGIKVIGVSEEPKEFRVNKADRGIKALTPRTVLT
jgi:hypothetical protein